MISISFWLIKGLVLLILAFFSAAFNAARALFQYRAGRALLAAIAAGAAAAAYHSPTWETEWAVFFAGLSFCLFLSVFAGLSRHTAEDEAPEEITPEAAEVPPADGDAEEAAEADDAFAILLRGRTIEKATFDEEKRLLALYRRKDKLEAINSTDAATWARFQQSKTWRGLLWDIEDAESTLARLDGMKGA